MRHARAVSVLALVLATTAALASESPRDFRLADWEVERLIAANTVLPDIAPLPPALFGLTAFPPPGLADRPSNVAAIALSDASVEATPEPSAGPMVAEAPADAPTPQAGAEPLSPLPPQTFALDLPADDPPSLVAEGEPDASITAARVSRALAELIARPADRRTPQVQAEIAEIGAFYARRGFQPLFTADGVLSPVGRAASQRMARAAVDGLDPLAFRVVEPEGTRNAERVAALELNFARAVALFARQASGGRTDPRRLSRDFDVSPQRIAAAVALAAVADAPDAASALDAFNPPHQGFQRLRRALANLRSDRREMQDTRAGRSREDLEREIVANMERWRWLPRELGAAHIWVNIPDYDIEVVRDGAVVHRTRGVVGRLETPTPVFSHAMNHIVFNPAWHVPHSIVRRDMLANATRDPNYFTRRGIQVVSNGRVVDPATINWASGNVGRFGFRQPPGERNALGRMKFMFPNSHAVYLHDTTARSLFARDQRAFSNGCIRVQNPEELAELLLNLGQPGETWTQSRIERLYGPSERTVRFTRPVPIHLVYFTVEADDDGRLRRMVDIYGHNARVGGALAGNRS